ncbi:MAG: lipopolysaccharide heptosyltransferase I [Gammaproteobacteria bacterium]|nr:lipopolysaccharide heptosyltransferase I [Gammaproteobacteria bacterium]
MNHKRVLIIKTSSMGDVIHALPALTDAMQAIPGIRFDWVVEEKFSEIPEWHPAIDRVIPVAIRQWRKNIFSRSTWRAFMTFLRAVKKEKYDIVIDAQGLVKSALIARMARGLHYGLDKKSARESFAAFFYQKKIPIERNQHAILRLRKLFAEVLNYPLPTTMPDYAIDRAKLIKTSAEKNYLVFLHGTTWATKHWPEAYWIALAKKAGENNMKVLLSWGSSVERARAEKIAAHLSHVEVLPSQSLLEMAQVLAGAKAVVALDTGLGHLAAALSVPTVSLYGPTGADLTGALGESQQHLSATFPPCSPCFSRVCHWQGEAPIFQGEKMQPACMGSLTPEKVWESLR